MTLAQNVSVETRTSSLRADAREAEGEMQRRRARRERDGVLGPDVRRELALESVDVRPDRGDPVRGEGFVDKAEFVLAEVRGGEIDAVSRRRGRKQKTRNRMVEGVTTRARGVADLDERLPRRQKVERKP